MAGSMTDRLKGAALLDINTYEEVEHDQTATAQAGGVVVLHAIAAAIGGWQLGMANALSMSLASLVGWAVWAFVTYFIGTRLFNGTATWGELLRTLGYAHAPGLLLVLGILPIIGWVVWPVVAIWMLVAGFIAVRQALDVGNGQAFLTVILGWGLLFSEGEP